MVIESEVVVIGGGPAGLSAALAAAQAGVKQVTLLDAYSVPGGQYYRQPPEFMQAQFTRHQQQGRALWEQVRQAGVAVINGTLVWYVNPEKQIIYQAEKQTYEMQAKAIVMATGAYDRPIAFPGWTLPGVMMTGGAQTLLYQHVLPGKRVLLAGTGPLQLVVARKLLDAGVEVAAVLEGNQVVGRAFKHLTALWGQWERMEEGLSSYLKLLTRRVPYRTGWGIVAAHGGSQVEGATIARLDHNWRPVPGSEQQVACDTICTGYGFIPFNSLLRQMGARQFWQEDLGGIVPERSNNLETSLAVIYAAGDMAGIGGARLSLIEGRIAGFSAAASLGYPPPAGALREVRHQQNREQAFQRLLLDLFTPGPGAYELAGDDTLICRCEGVTKKMLVEAVERGAKSVVELKSETRCGMGECQGRMCEQGVLHLMEQISRQPVEAGNSYHLRPPVFPIPIEALGQISTGGDS